MERTKACVNIQKDTTITTVSSPLAPQPPPSPLLLWSAVDWVLPAARGIGTSDRHQWSAPSAPLQLWRHRVVAASVTGALVCGKQGTPLTRWNMSRATLYLDSKQSLYLIHVCFYYFPKACYTQSFWLNTLFFVYKNQLNLAEYSDVLNSLTKVRLSCS